MEAKKGGGPAQGMSVWFSTTQSTRLPAHLHPVVELNLVMTGSLTYRIEDKLWLVAAGQLLILPKEKPHALLKVSPDVALWVAELSMDACIMLQETNSESLSDAECYRLNPTDSWRRQLLHSLKKIWLRPPEAMRLKYEQQAYATLRNIETRAFENRPPPHEAVVRARAICERENCSAKNVEAIAREAGISPSRLAHLFQQELGVSPLQYRNFARLQHFIQICDLEKPSLLKAALTAGFGSYPQFHRIFQQVTGESPSEHLKWLLSADDVEASVTLGAEKKK